MIKIVELLHGISLEKKSGLIDIDSWTLPAVSHLVDMGFEFVDDYRMSTTKPPKIIIYKKKEDGKEWFVIEEPDKPLKRFENFNDIIDYFDSYEQPEIDKKVE